MNNELLVVAERRQLSFRCPVFQVSVRRLDALHVEYFLYVAILRALTKKSRQEAKAMIIYFMYFTTQVSDFRIVFTCWIGGSYRKYWTADRSFFSTTVLLAAHPFE